MEFPKINASSVRIVLVRPGSTDFDQQGRIKGSLDIPLNAEGASQVAAVVGQVSHLPIEKVYTSPSQSSHQTAVAIADALGVRVAPLEQLRNWNQGLWQGKLIDEVRQQQPKVYRLCQEHPEAICPPDGEMLDDARDRARAALNRIVRKHRGGMVAVVAPEPLASLIHQELCQCELGDLWKAECDACRWETIDTSGVGRVPSRV